MLLIITLGAHVNLYKNESDKPRTKHKHFFLSDEEANKVDFTIKKIKKKYNYKYDVEAFIHLVDNYIERENHNEKN